MLTCPCPCGCGHTTLQDAIVDFLPSPLDRPPALATLVTKQNGSKVGKGKKCKRAKAKEKAKAAAAAALENDEGAAQQQQGQQVEVLERRPDVNEPLCALAFKVQHSRQKKPQVGRY